MSSSQPWSVPVIGTWRAMPPWIWIAAKMFGQTGVTHTTLSPADTRVCTISIMAFMPLLVTAMRKSAISTP